MTRILIYIKHNISFIWTFIEYLNGSIFSLLYKNKLNHILSNVLPLETNGYNYRKVNAHDIPALSEILIENTSHFEYFKPHLFDAITLRKLHKNSAFLMMCAEDRNKIVGYFFLRFFSNKKAFIGRMVDVSHQGRGIAKPMSTIMYDICHMMDFDCLTTISFNNTKIVQLHESENNFTILKKLENDYLLIKINKS